MPENAVTVDNAISGIINLDALPKEEIKAWIREQFGLNQEKKQASKKDESNISGQVLKIAGVIAAIFSVSICLIIVWFLIIKRCCCQCFKNMSMKLYRQLFWNAVLRVML